MPRFFISPGNITTNIATITGDDAHHIGKVLRMRVGDEIVLCDGQGTDYTANISEIAKSYVTAGITGSCPNTTEPPIEVWLFQALPKASKMEYIIQKCTELGVSHIVPCIMSHCVVKLEDESSMLKKTERWQSVAYEAAKQSGRGSIPHIHMPMTLDDTIFKLKELDLGCTLYEKETQICLKSVFASVRSPKTVGFLIGPEGGISGEEAISITSSGIPTVTLGPRILRTETAGEAVIAMAMYEIGDIN